jgi:transposase
MKVFREPDSVRPQLFISAMCVDEFVPHDSYVRVLDKVVNALDLYDILRRYPGGGAPAYHPRMLLKLLIFAYSQGIRSSRRIAELCERDLWCMFLCEMQKPDFHTIARFRRKHEQAFKALFLHTVHSCQEEGLVLLEHVAVDGTKIEADVSGKRTYSAKRAEQDAADAQVTIDRILAEAEAADQEDELNDQTTAAKRSRALQNLKRRKEHAEAALKEIQETGRSTIATTDLDSRVMKTGSGNRPAFNAQAAVDDAHGVIVAAAITQDSTDGAQLPQMVPEIARNTGFEPACVTADTGFNTPETLEAMEEQEIDAYIAQYSKRPSREGFAYDADTDEITHTDPQTGNKMILKFYRMRKHSNKTYRVYRDAKNKKDMYFTLRPDKELEQEARMRAKLQTAAGKAIYKKRQETVEPVFGHIKSRLGLRRFILRGKSGATVEFLLACSAHNILKIACSALLRLISALFLVGIRHLRQFYRSAHLSAGYHCQHTQIINAGLARAAF